MFTSILVNVRRRDVIAETLFVDLEANFFPISGKDYELDLVLFVEPPELSGVENSSKIFFCR